MPRRPSCRQPALFQALESRRLLTATYSPSDLAGPWLLSAMASHGDVVFNLAGQASGSVTDDNNVTSTPGGTYLLTSTGTVTASTNAGISGAMNSSKNLIAYSTTSVDSLSLLANRGSSAFVNSDISGSWNLFTNGSPGGGDNSGSGTLNFDGVGAVTGTYTPNIATPVSAITGTYTLATTGNLNFLNAGTLYTGAMTSTKDVVLLSPGDLKAAATANNPRMLVLVKRSGTYSNSDLAGTWVVSFDGGTGTLSFNGAGKIVGGSITNSTGTLTASGTYTVNANGTFSTKITTKANHGASVTSFSGALNASKDVAVADRPADTTTPSDDLLVLVRAGAVNHSPTLTKVAQMKSAEAGAPFTITYDQLAKAGNEADVDGDPLSFQIDSVVNGTLSKNGVAVTAGDIVGKNDTLTWTPDPAAKGAVTAFSVKAYDGAAASSPAIPVKVTVTGKTTLSIKAGKPALEAGAKPSTFTVSRANGNKSLPVTVSYTISGTATNGADCATLSGTVVIPAKKPSTTISVTPIDDHTVETNETVIVTLAEDPAYVVTANKSSATMTITDGSPTMTVKATRSKASETNPTTSGKGTYTFKRSGGDLKSPLTVLYAMSGGATNGTDYNDLVGSITFPAGKSSITLDLLPTADQEIEGTETAILTLIPDANPSYKIGTFASATINIADAV